MYMDSLYSLSTVCVIYNKYSKVFQTYCRRQSYNNLYGRVAYGMVYIQTSIPPVFHFIILFYSLGSPLLISFENLSSKTTSKIHAKFLSIILLSKLWNNARKLHRYTYEMKNAEFVYRLLIVVFELVTVL